MFEIIKENFGNLTKEFDQLLLILKNHTVEHT